MVDKDKILPDTTDTIPVSVTTSVEIVFGKRLKKARENQRLSIADAADRLRLDQKILESIEADEYYDKSHSVFVCGHIRSYARLLEIPSEEVDQIFEQLGIQTRRSHVKPQQFEIKHPVLKDKSVRLITYTIIAVLFGLLLTWYLSHRNKVNTNAFESAMTQSVSDNSTITPSQISENTDANPVNVTTISKTQSKNLNQTQNQARAQNTTTEKTTQQSPNKKDADLPWLKK